MDFIFKNESGNYYVTGGDIATNKYGEPVDAGGKAVAIQTSDAAIEAIYGDLAERVGPSYRELVEQHLASVAEKVEAENKLKAETARTS